MKNSLSLRFVTSALVLGTLAFSAGVQAKSWEPGGINDPKWFNTTWHPAHYTNVFNQLPLSGSVENQHIPWGDSYWPMNRGSMAYRWKANQDENADPETMTDSDRTSKFLNIHKYSKDELLGMSAEAQLQAVTNMSPLEKYSLYIGDYNYGLTDKYLKSSNASRSYWQGYCHAWAPVALHYPEPQPVTMRNADGIVIPFGSADVKATMITAYSKHTEVSFSNVLGAVGKKLGRLFGGKSESGAAAFIGKRCSLRFMYPVTKIKNGKEVFASYGDTSGVMNKDYPDYLKNFQKKALELNYTPDGGPAVTDPDFVNKALANMNDPDCEDVNAGAFHVVIGNQLGIMKEGFQFDKTRDMEIWNQPAFRFESKVIGYENPTVNSSPGTSSVIHLKTRLYYADDTDYGWAYWFPTLPNLFSPEAGFMAEFDRYQKLLMKVGDIKEPGKYPDGVIAHADYEYTIELNDQKEIIGGDWLTFDRPDFLWLLKKYNFDGEFEKLNEIYKPVHLPANQEPNLGD